MVAPEVPVTYAPPFTLISAPPPTAVIVTGTVIPEIVISSLSTRVEGATPVTGVRKNGFGIESGGGPVLISQLAVESPTVTPTVYVESYWLPVVAFTCTY